MVETSPDSNRTPAQAFAAAVAIIGDQTATARELGVTQQSISARLTKRQPCAEGWALKLERLTRISRHELRPDIYPPEPAPARAGGAALEPAR